MGRARRNPAVAAEPPDDRSLPRRGGFSMKDVAPKVTIEPIRGLRVLKDLVVDMDPFWEKFKAMKPYLQPGYTEPPEGREHLITQERMNTIHKESLCINCGCCVSECNAMESDPRFLGPQALAKGMRFVGDPRDAAAVEADQHRVARADPHLVLLLAEGEAGRALFHQEGGGAARPLVAVAERDDGVELRLAAVRDPLLGAVQDPLLAVARRGGADGAGVAAGVRADRSGGLGRALRIALAAVLAESVACGCHDGKSADRRPLRGSGPGLGCRRLRLAQGSGRAAAAVVDVRVRGSSGTLSRIPAGELVAVRAAQIIDGRGGEPLKPGIVLIRGERIEAVGGTNLRIPPGARVIDLGSATVLPGLIDLHTHLTDKVGTHWEEALTKTNPAQAALYRTPAWLVTEAGFASDLEGISIYPTSDATGYLLVSNQQANTFRIFPREGSPAGTHQHPLLSSVRLSTQESDGSDVTAAGGWRNHTRSSSTRPFGATRSIAPGRSITSGSKSSTSKTRSNVPEN